MLVLGVGHKEGSQDRQVYEALSMIPFLLLFLLVSMLHYHSFMDLFSYFVCFMIHLEYALNNNRKHDTENKYFSFFYL